MKRVIGMLMSGVMLCILCACAKTEPKVPDLFVMEVVEKSFEAAEITTKHDMDDETHIDTVSVEVIVSGEYGKEYYKGVCTYRYHKSDDTWEYYGEDPDWQFDHCKLNEDAFIGSFNSGLKTGGIFSGNISSIDFKNCTVTGSFFAQQINNMGDCKVDVTGTFSIQEYSKGYTLEIPYRTYMGVVDIVLEITFTKDGIVGEGFMPG